MSSHSKNSTIGVKLVHTSGTDPEDPRTYPVVDIVAVHGLKGDAYRTWTAKGQNKGEQDVFWLKDLLPLEIRRARILTYGYDSDPGKVFESSSTNMIHHHATTLVSELHFFRRRDNEKERPIIFICHSLGGIVVKRALIYSASCNLSHNIKLRSIKVSTFGILFLGTPHMGSDLAKWGKMAEKLVRSVTPKTWIDTNNSLVKALAKNSETLQNITELFLGISDDFKMFFFWEELKTTIPGMVGVTRDVIVEFSSAVPEALPNAGRSVIHATHSDMCKFTDEEAPGWNVLAGCLCDFVDEAPQTVYLKWEQEKRRTRGQEVDRMEGFYRQSMQHGHSQMLPPPWSPELPPTIGPPRTVGMIEGKNETLQGEGVEGLGAGEKKKLDFAKNTSIDQLPPFVKPFALQENKYFEGREYELKEIDKILHDPKKRAVSISSVTGGGKTHLAREYFFRNTLDFPGGAFWIDCKPMTADTKTLDLGFQLIAEKLRLNEHPGGFEGSSDVQVEMTRMRVLDWFENNNNWLLVLDGVDVEHNPYIDNLAKYVPKGKGGSMILTTLNPSLAGAARVGSPEPLNLEKPNEREACNMLLHYAQIRSVSEKENQAATKLVNDLGYLPLAIHSAGSYIKGKKISISDYLKKYEKRPFVERENLEPVHILLDRVKETHIEADRLLRILAFVHREIPVQMLLWGMAHLPNNIQLIAKENGRHDFNNTIGHLLSYSLVDRTSVDEGQEYGSIQVDTLVIHSVIQDVCIFRLNKSKGELKKWLELAITLFCGSFAATDLRRRDIDFLVSDYRRYEVHGARILGHAKKYKVSVDRLEEVLVRVRDAIGNSDDSSGPRQSMFRSGSYSDTDPPSPISTQMSTWNMTPGITPVMESPVDTFQLKDARGQVSRAKPEDEHITRNEMAEDSDVDKPRPPVKHPWRHHQNIDKRSFKFRYEPPKGPRNPRGGGAPIQPKPPDSTQHVFTRDVFSPRRKLKASTIDSRRNSLASNDPSVLSSSPGTSSLQAILNTIPGARTTPDPKLAKRKWTEPSPLSGFGLQPRPSYNYSSQHNLGSQADFLDPRQPLHSNPYLPSKYSTTAGRGRSTASRFSPDVNTDTASPTSMSAALAGMTPPSSHWGPWPRSGSLPPYPFQLEHPRYGIGSADFIPSRDPPANLARMFDSPTTVHQSPLLGNRPRETPFYPGQSPKIGHHVHPRGDEVLEIPSGPPQSPRPPLWTETTDGRKPRPFAPGFRPNRDLSSSPGGIVGPRPAPSETCSEPIIEPEYQFSSEYSTPTSQGMMRGRSGTGRSIGGVSGATRPSPHFSTTEPLPRLNVSRPHSPLEPYNAILMGHQRSSGGNSSSPYLASQPMTRQGSAGSHRSSNSRRGSFSHSTPFAKLPPIPLPSDLSFDENIFPDRRFDGEGVPGLKIQGIIIPPFEPGVHVPEVTVGPYTPDPHLSHTEQGRQQQQYEHTDEMYANWYKGRYGFYPLESSEIPPRESLRGFGYEHDYYCPTQRLHPSAHSHYRRSSAPEEVNPHIPHNPTGGSGGGGSGGGDGDGDGAAGAEDMQRSISEPGYRHGYSGLPGRSLDDLRRGGDGGGGG